jgi:hypothetical protein
MTAGFDMDGWRLRLQAAGNAGLIGSPLDPALTHTQNSLQDFRDASGQRHPSHPPFLARLLGVAVPTPNKDWNSSRHPDARLWWGVLDISFLTDDCFANTGGPLWPELVREGVEAWTLVELRGLHALWWIGTLHQMPHLCARALDAASWHIEEMQPDNATNRPWAVHVFLQHAARCGGSEGEMFAQTLLHNALITGGGKAETISAAILVDASKALSD